MLDITPEIAELAGIFAADGCMQKNYLCFWGNITEDKEYYDNTLKNLFKKAFNIDINPHPKKSNSVYGFYICNKDIISFFNKNLGFPIGNKTPIVSVPKVVITSNDNNVWSSFVRGFCDGDGCLSFDRRYDNRYRKFLRLFHTYPRIQIKCVSYNLIKGLSTLLKKLDIAHITCKGGMGKKTKLQPYLLQISGEARLKKWIQFVGFSNKVHQSKYEIFKRYGFVPVHISLSQRKMILEGKIDPHIFYPTDP